MRAAGSFNTLWGTPEKRTVGILSTPGSTWVSAIRHLITRVPRREKGLSEFQVCRYRLVRDDPNSVSWQAPPGKELPPPPRTKTTIQRVVRSSAVMQTVKQIHGFQCQICGLVLMGPTGPYAEGAHIKPLGRPHKRSEKHST